MPNANEATIRTVRTVGDSIARIIEKNNQAQAKSIIAQSLALMTRQRAKIECMMEAAQALVDALPVHQKRVLARELADLHAAMQIDIDKR